MMHSVDLERARATARTLAIRAQQDPRFAEQLLQNPTSVLTAAGLPEDFVQEFLERTQLSDVQGYISPSCGLTVIL